MATNSRTLILIFLSTILLLLPVESVCMPRPKNPVYPFVGSADDPPAAAAPAPAPSSSPPAPSSLPPISGDFKKLVKGFCTHTDNPDLCFSSVEPYLGLFLGNPVNASSILEMEIKACAAKSQAALEVSSKISQDPKTGKMMAAILQTCTDNYDDAVDNLDSAVKALREKDFPTLNGMLSAALTDFTTCEDGFVETPGINSPMKEFDDVLTKLGSNCLALAELVK